MPLRPFAETALGGRGFASKGRTILQSVGRGGGGGGCERFLLTTTGDGVAARRRTGGAWGSRQGRGMAEEAVKRGHVHELASGTLFPRTVRARTNFGDGGGREQRLMGGPAGGSR